MQKIRFTHFIDAPREKVWNVMLSDATYREWTKPFSPGGYFKGDWSEGSKIQFIGPDPETGKEGGMSSRIAANRKPKFISIEHLGIIKDGVEDFTSPEVKKWAPSFENYTFKEKNGGTELLIEMDIADEYKAEFESMWPKALAELKRVAER